VQYHFITLTLPAAAAVWQAQVTRKAHLHTASGLAY